MRTLATPEKITRRILVLFVWTLIMLFSIQVKAQDRFSLQLRPSFSIATVDPDNENLNTGYGFDGIAAYRFMPHVSVYAGWGWNKFSVDQSFAGADKDFEETGYTFGLQYIHPFSQTSSLDYFVRGGGIYNHIEIENTEGEIIADSGHGLGIQVEAGLAIPLGDKWNLLPGIRL
jgi:hypothetical protein